MYINDALPHGTKVYLLFQAIFHLALIELNPHVEVAFQLRMIDQFIKGKDDCAIWIHHILPNTAIQITLKLRSDDEFIRQVKGERRAIAVVVVGICKSPCKDYSHL